jgi:hypothetical protein
VAPKRDNSIPQDSRARRFHPVSQHSFLPFFALLVTGVDKSSK